MNKKEKPSQEIMRNWDYSQLNINEFFKALNKAISTNNTQSIYELSKLFTRYCFKNLDN